MECESSFNVQSKPAPGGRNTPEQLQKNMPKDGKISPAWSAFKRDVTDTSERYLRIFLGILSNVVMQGGAEMLHTSITNTKNSDKQQPIRAEEQLY